jgi:hypothetical protein
VFILKALQVPLNVVGEVGITRLPAVAAGVLPRLDVKPVLPALGLFDIGRPDLWYLESP